MLWTLYGVDDIPKAFINVIKLIGFIKLIKRKFKTNDTSVRFHKDDENLMQMVYQIISAYFEDDCADELTLDPVFNAILEKNSLASQPTLSRFFNRMEENTLLQFDDIDKSLRDIIYSIKCPEHMLLDLDSTLFSTYGVASYRFSSLSEARAMSEEFCFKRMA